MSYTTNEDGAYNERKPFVDPSDGHAIIRGDWPNCEGCGKPLSPVTLAMDTVPYCTDCIRDQNFNDYKRPTRGQL